VSTSTAVIATITAVSRRRGRGRDHRAGQADQRTAALRCRRTDTIARSVALVAASTGLTEGGWALLRTITEVADINDRVIEAC